MAENDFLTNIDKIIATIPALKKEFNTKLTNRLHKLITNMHKDWEFM